MTLTDKKITELDLDFVRGYLKVDYTDENNLIEAFILAARSYIETLLGYKITDRWPITADIPSELTIAALMVISNWFDNRQLQLPNNMSGEIAFAVSAIVDSHKLYFKDNIRKGKDPDTWYTFEPYTIGTPPV